jgi:DNA-binding XRE family transcriptional regulator
LRRLSFLSPMRLLTCEETPQTSQRLPSGVGRCADALDFSWAIRNHTPVGQGPSGGACRLTRGAVFISAYIIPQIFTIVYRYGKIFTVNYGTMEVDVDTIKELRINAGLSQRELATRAGLTPGAVWQVEHRGSGSPATLKKLADVLGVRPVDLLKERR